MRVEILPEAEDDMAAIGVYIAQQGSPLAGERMVRRLYSACRSLADFPERQGAFEDFGRGVKQLPVWPYLILFQIGDEVVSVLSVRHGARRPGPLRR